MCGLMTDWGLMVLYVLMITDYSQHQINVQCLKYFDAKCPIKHVKCFCKLIKLKFVQRAKHFLGALSPE